MKKSQIKIGGVYRALVNGKLVPCRVDSIEESTQRRGGPLGGTCAMKSQIYHVTNLATGRKTTFRSAMKFREEVQASFTDAVAKEAIAPGQAVSLEDEQRGPFPTSTQPTTQVLLPSADSSKLASPNNGDSSLASIVKRVAAAQQQRKPTEEQEEVLRLGKDLARRADTLARAIMVIEAGAGTGKTTTLKMLEDALPGRGQYTAFNKSLVDESKRKFSSASCDTTHALAFRAVGKSYAHRLGGSRVRSEQVARMLGLEDLAIEVETSEGPKAKILPAALLAGQVSGAIRRFCQSADPEPVPSHFRRVDGIDVPGEPQVNNEKLREHLLPFARRMWADLSDPGGQMPFAHDHYVKVWQLGNPVISADYILLDEAQDTAPVVLDVLRQQQALVILVGDSAQQIYEWRGAVNAMAAFEGAPRLFLSQSFRFGPAVADVANRVLSCLSEPTPLRLKGLESIPSRVGPIANPTAILTRTNAAAVAHVLRAITEGRRPCLIGKQDDVIGFVEGALLLQQGRRTSNPELACFDSWTEVQAYAKLEEGEDLKVMVKLVDQFGAKEILAALRGMPREQDADLVVCTAHKSKGREWDRVKLAQDFPTRSKCGDPDLKLLYVAATRAKLELDLSECPFFTGQDALEIPPPIHPDDVLGPRTAPTPSAPTSFTWSKGRQGDWLVRGPAGATGEVSVEAKDGRKATKRILSVVWQDGATALYKVS